MNFWEKVKLAFSKIFDFLKPAAEVLMRAGGPILVDIAVDAVRATANYGLDDDETKRRMAYRDIEARLKALGKDISAHAINLAIELALAKLKAKS